jgi:hypothetical protein
VEFEDSVILFGETFQLGILECFVQSTAQGVTVLFNDLDVRWFCFLGHEVRESVPILKVNGI